MKSIILILSSRYKEDYPALRFVKFLESLQKVINFKKLANGALVDQCFNFPPISPKQDTRMNMTDKVQKTPLKLSAETTLREALICASIVTIVLSALYLSPLGDSIETQVARRIEFSVRELAGAAPILDERIRIIAYEDRTAGGLRCFRGCPRRDHRRQKRGDESRRPDHDPHR